MPRADESITEWLRIARGDLAIAKGKAAEDVPLELLCFHAQQAAEKAIKVVLIIHGVKPPKIHDIGVLLDLLPSSVQVGPEIDKSRALTYYATAPRYPMAGAKISNTQYREAVRLAEAVLSWAEEIIGS